MKQQKSTACAANAAGGASTEVASAHTAFGAHCATQMPSTVMPATQTAINSAKHAPAELSFANAPDSVPLANTAPGNKRSVLAPLSANNSISPAKPAAPQLSAEAQRQARIAANMARMRELGLENLGASLQPEAKKQKPAAPKPKPEVPSEPVRKSESARSRPTMRTA